MSKLEILPTPLPTPSTEEGPVFKRPAYDNDTEQERLAKRPRATQQSVDELSDEESLAIPTTWLVTGASRGLGFAFVQFLSRDPHNVVLATCRDPSSADKLRALASVRATTSSLRASVVSDLEEEGKTDGLNSEVEKSGELHILKLDVEDEASITEAATEAEHILGTRGLGLDYLLNNAGVVRFSRSRPCSWRFDDNTRRTQGTTRLLHFRYRNFYERCVRMSQVPLSSLLLSCHCCVLALPCDQSKDLS